MLDPVTLYKDGRQSRRIPVVDAPGWIAAGWSLEPPAATSPDPIPELKSTRRKVRNAGDTIPED
ncbi:hypothetical protein [Anabaena sp. CCY 9910]|uniref:hypothetical protein n=1 Tax=Anabaena sp. CCY 9910 TaxID=3103870 RepID=UPI0039E02162